LVVDRDEPPAGQLPALFEQSGIQVDHTFMAAAVGENETQLSAGDQVTVVILERRYI
jgi:hypothetical protein